MIECDYVMSLGFNCNVANALIKCFMRRYSSPFDWNDSSMNIVLENFKNEFEGWFNRDNFKFSKQLLKPACELRNGSVEIVYVHDGQYTDLIKNDAIFNHHYEKYQRRIKRLMQIMNDNKRICLIRLQPQSVKEYEKLKKLIDIIKENYDVKSLNIVYATNEEIKDPHPLITLIPKNNLINWISKNIKAPLYKQIIRKKGKFHID